jgi:restriction endonuclease S subunit
MRQSFSNRKNIKVPLPPLTVQQQIVTEIEIIEAQIADLEAQLKEIPKQKEEILKRYL